MAEGIGYAILGRIGENLVDPIGRQLRYLFCFNNNIQNLQTQLEDLKTTRDGVQLGVDQARNNVRIVEPQVEAWLIKVNQNTTEAEAIIESKAQVQKGCLKGLCLCHYTLSRKAVKKSQDLVCLQDDRVKFTQLSHSPPPPSIESIPTTEFRGFDSRTLVMNEIIKALKDDGINLIGICGMGGIGKTTMAKEVAKRAKEENLFNEVAMAVVSQEPNLIKVQGCIADMLGLKLGDRECPITRASLLRKRLLLDNRKILVILDDIWEEFNLEDLGFPLGGDANKGGCKFLFTSRFRNMWRVIQNKRYIQLEVLLKDEAWDLFRKKAGDCADAPDLKPLAKEIVDECGGLPLALVTMGSALMNERNQHHWKDALRQLRTPCSESILSGVPAKVYQALDFSYNCLKDEGAKKLFLHCCLFLEDHSISIEWLVRFVIGLQWFEGIDKVDEVRDRVYVLVDQLKSCYLLLDGDREEQVKMHDVVRDVAISIASREKHGFLIIHGEKWREWPKKATYEPYTSISVISDEIAEFPDGLRCPKLVLLLIGCGNSSLKIPSNFVEGMGELKVLLLEIDNNLLLPSSLQILSNLRTLVIVADCQLENISIIGKLLNLEILNFYRSKIKELPKEIGRLANLRMLDLWYCEDLERIPPGVISALVQLQELYMGGCKNLNWEREGNEEGENASLRELESLSNLNTLEIYIKVVVCLPRIPLFSKLTKYKILIGNDSDFSFDMKKFQKVLHVRLEDTCPILLECGGINLLLRSTQFLELKGKGTEAAVQELFREGVKGLQQLMHLSISECETPEYFANTMDWVPYTPNTTAVFHILESLQLSHLPNLKKICHGQHPSSSFGKLKRLEISNCDRMEEIIFWKERGEEDDATTSNKIEFPNLEIMTLGNLPRLVGFCRGIDEIEFPQLKELHLQGLPQVKWLFPNNSNPSSDSMENHNAAVLSLFPHKVAFPSLEKLNLKHLDNLEGLGQNSISVGSFSKLKNIYVLHCGKLLYVFPSELLLMLRNLEALTVEDCDLLEKVFELEVTDSREQESKMLLLLKSLKLRRLPQLNYISKRDPIGFMYTPQLSILHVHDCDNLRYLFPHSVMKSNLQLQELEIRRCKMMSRIVGEENGQGKSLVDKIEFTQLKILWLDDLPNLVSFFPKVIDTMAASTEHLQNVMQTLFNEKVVFPNLEVLQLEHLDNPEVLGHDPLSSASLSKLRKIHVRHCGKLLKVFPSQLLTRLRNLEEVTIEDCSLLKKVFELEVVDCTEHDSKIFLLLKSLKLKTLPQLNHISERDPIGFMYIPQLSILHIDGHDNLRFLFLQSMMKSMLQLQELEIRSCKMMSKIVAEENGQGESSVEKIEFAQLKILQLYDLPNLVSFFPKVITTMAASIEHLEKPGQSLFNEKVAFPGLEELKLDGIQNMNEIWCSHPQKGSFYKLTKLRVSNCASLRNLFSPYMARYLVHLRKLVIDKCSAMEEVVAAKEENEKEGEGRVDRTPILPKLKYLKLRDLPVLKSFCHITHDWELSLVDDIRVLNCPAMKTFSPGVICTPKLQLVLVKEGKYPWDPYSKGAERLWMGDLNQTTLHLNEKHEVGNEEGEAEMGTTRRMGKAIICEL